MTRWRNAGLGQLLGLWSPSSVRARPIWSPLRRKLAVWVKFMILISFVQFSNSSKTYAKNVYGSILFFYYMVTFQYNFQFLIIANFISLFDLKRYTDLWRHNFDKFKNYSYLFTKSPVSLSRFQNWRSVC